MKSTHRIQPLTSPANQWLKTIRRSVVHGDLTSEGLCVCEGFHLLDEALQCGRQVAVVVISGDAARERVERLLGPLAGARVFEVNERLFHGLAATESPQGVLSLVLAPKWTIGDVCRGSGPLVVLDAVQEPGNAGAILRSAEAFGACGAVFLKGSASPYNAKNIRASAGSLFRLPFVHDVMDIHFLAAANERPRPMFAAMPDGEVPLDRADLRGDCTLIFGNEGRGVRPEIARHATAVRIPTRGVESLNAGVAAGIVLYEAWRQRMSA